MLQYCVIIQFIQTPTVKRVQYSGRMERKHSVQKTRLRTRCKNSSKIHRSPVFLMASSLRIAESEGRGSNSNSQSVPILLLQLLGIRYFCFEFCRRSCVTVSFWFPLGIVAVMCRWVPCRCCVLGYYRLVSAAVYRHVFYTVKLPDL